MDLERARELAALFLASGDEVEVARARTREVEAVAREAQARALAAEAALAGVQKRALIAEAEVARLQAENSKHKAQTGGGVK
jgi:hypothetical protein